MHSTTLPPLLKAPNHGAAVRGRGRVLGEDGGPDKRTIAKIGGRNRKGEKRKLGPPYASTDWRSHAADAVSEAFGFRRPAPAARGKLAMARMAATRSRFKPYPSRLPCPRWQPCVAGAAELRRLRDGARALPGLQGDASIAVANRRQTLHFLPVFAPLCLDTGAIAAISPRNPARGVLAPLVFVSSSARLPGGEDGVPRLHKRTHTNEPITTEQEAGPAIPRPGSNTKDENDVRSHQDRRPAIPRRSG